MSRLSSYQQKQFRNKLIFYILCISTLVILLLTFGLKLIVNTTLFISGLTSDKKNSQATEKKDDFYGILNIDDLPVATNSANLSVSGYSSNFDKIEFYLNNEKVKEISLKSSEIFNEEIGDLKLGTNEIYLKAATKKSKDEKKSQLFTVLYKNEKPKLEITEPSDSSKTTQSSIKLAGRTESEIYIKVSRLPLVTDSNGNFQTTVNLNPGENKIVVTAEDNAGNIETKTITVIYQKDE
ncbi:MAG: hypothetical protein HYW86_02975 [Candidatus Roizmanbacteria bacterium]|nr:MAG: hypothetical protein HYW86_02975 [Candidatus Roizmanbacteria bacterium]